MYYLSFDLSEFSNSINQNGVTIFISGFLLTLSLYHFLLFFQHKDKAYLYYSLYTVLIFLYIYHRANHFFLADISRSAKPFLSAIVVPLQWLFYMVYIRFLQTYLELKTHLPKLNKLLNSTLLLYFTLLLILMIQFGLSQDYSFFFTVQRYFFVPSFVLLSLYSLFRIAQLPSTLKYYVIIGSILYILFGVIAFYTSLQQTYGGLLFFYMAIFIENIFFALGLGAKQKKILTERNQAQQSIIKEHAINIELQKRIKEKLDKEVAKKTQEIIQLHRQNADEHRRKLAAEFSKKTLDLRMKALQTQMNPHFLFNSLNAIKHFIIKNKKEDATYFLSKLSRLLRKILDNSQLQEISLQEELAVMQLYLEVENIRLDKHILMEQKNPDQLNLSNFKIPPLVLQPFIENAIWHGLALKKGHKKIVITIKKDNAYLQISIEDNGIGRERAAVLKAAKLVEKESLGISLTKERLVSYTEHLKGKVSIVFDDLMENNQSKGTRVILKIPVLAS